MTIIEIKDSSTNNNDLLIINNHNNLPTNTKFQINPVNHYGNYSILNYPIGIVYNQEKYFVSTGNNNIKVLNNELKQIRILGTYGDDETSLSTPQQINIISSKNILLVADSGNNRIQMISSNDCKFLGSFGQDVLETPKACCYQPLKDQIIAADFQNQCHLFDIQGSLMRSFSGHGDGNETYTYQVYNVCFDQEHKRILVTDNYHKRLLIWDQDGKELINSLSLGKKYPLSITIDPINQDVLVGCKTEIMVFDSHIVKPYQVFGSHGNSPGQFAGGFYGISGMCFNDLNQLTVTDTENHRLQVFKKKL